MRTAQASFLQSLIAGLRRASPAQVAQQPLRELGPQQLRHVVGGTTDAPRGVW